MQSKWISTRWLSGLTQGKAHDGRGHRPNDTRQRMHAGFSRLPRAAGFWIGLLALSGTMQLIAATGDNAPPIPATYNTSHPRLPAPDGTYLTNLGSNSGVLSAYNSAADSWSSTNPGNAVQFRRLLLAYMANKTVNPPKAATYLAKITALANLGGTWGTLIYSVNDGLGNGTYTLTSASANFLTGCGGASCQGNVLSISARTYIINSVTNANTVVLNTSNPAPTGSNLPIRIFSNLNSASQTGINIAMIYDWLYNDLDAATRTEFQNELDTLCTLWEQGFVGYGASPYNDVFYLDVGPYGLIGALAIYPDNPKGLTHLRYAMDVWFNILMPVWSQAFGPEGGGWHESWSDYIDPPGGNGLTTFIVPTLLSWQVASGDPIFTRLPWLKNFAYYTMYMTRPDFTVNNIGDIARPYLTEEYHITSGAGMGSLNGLAEIYNDPVLRGWARLVNQESPSGPNGLEPSAWPFYTPDKNSNAVSTRLPLPLTHNFTGWGLLDVRTGWTEDDTDVTFKYGDNLWSHEHADLGAFTIFNRGGLALDSGGYRPGYNSQHEKQYARQTIAHNTLTITDPADTYTTTFFGYDTAGNSIEIPIPNDGGQRRVGSPYNERFSQLNSPNVLGDWMRNWDYYHMGQMVGFASTPSYTYTAVDITAAYNNKYSPGTPNATNRTNRVGKAVRHLLFIPRGTSAYVVVFDQVSSTNASFVKRWLLHTVNQPVISGSSFTATRSELVNELPYNWTQAYASQLKYCPNNNCASGNQYQYNGKLYGWMVLPAGGNINVVGGPGKEFWIEDPQNPGTGTNWNQCQPGQCPANVEGLGPVDNLVNPDPTTGPHEFGSWRIEESPASGNLNDMFLNVMLATTTGDTRVPANVTVPAGLAAGTVGATWVDNGVTYVVTFPQTGVGGHITIGTTVNEDLMSRAQQLPGQLQLVSGTSQSAPSGSQLPNPLVASVTDASGNPVPGASVHFGIIQGNGRLVADTVTTDARGYASANLVLGAGAAGAVTSVMADVNGLRPVQFDATLSTASTATLTALSCTPAALAPGATAACTLALSQAAPTGGLTVTLASSAAAVTVPATVAISSGATGATFTATAVTGGQSATITATLGSSTQTASLTVQSVSITVTSVTCAQPTLTAGASTGCTVPLSAAAGTGGATVTLSSNSTLLTVPASVTVAAGATTAPFTAAAATTVPGTITAVLTAQFGATSQTATFTLQGASAGTPIVTGNWTMVPTHGYPVQTVAFEKLVYAPTPVKKAVMLGNYHELGSEPNAALIAYDFESNRWSVLDIGASFHGENMPEAGHPIGAFTYNPNLNTFMYYCCNSGSNQPENPYYMWWYDPIGQTGKSKQSTPKPGFTQLESAAFDPLNNTYVLQGGGGSIGTWTYNPTTNVFQQQTPAGTPPSASINFPAMTYNSTDHQVYLFGGASSNVYSNDLYKYNVATNTWTKLSPAGSRPAPRLASAFAYDSTNNIFMVFGGQDATTIYSDTWVYNPVTNAWTQLAPSQTPTVNANAPYERLAYDSDHNVFIMVTPGSGGYADGAWNGYGAQTWFFRYAGTGPNPGTVTASFQPTANSINRNSDAWAKEPFLAASGTTLYSAWVETGRPFDTSDGTWFHVYAGQQTSGGWNMLGGLPTSLDSEFANYSESHSPSIAVVAGSPWVSWYKSNNSGQLWALWAKRWSGATWVGGAVGQVGTDPTKAFQGRSQMIDVGGTPYIAFLEVDKTFYPQKTFVYVKYWNGTAWTLRGSGPLNINTALNTTAGSVSIASDGTGPYVTWTEYTSASWNLQSQTIAQVYVAHWVNGQWVNVGGSLNMNASSWAEDPSIAYLNGQPYVAWTERTTAGNAQVYVKTFTGGNWVQVGAGSLNKNTSTGWAFHPNLASDGISKLYLGWVEQAALGQPSQAYVSSLVAGAWSPVGSSLNADPGRGSAQRLSLAVVGGQPVAAWGEVNFGSLRQVFVKQWNGTAWNLLSGTGTTISFSPCDINRDGAVNSSDVQLAINQALGVAACGAADLMGTGQCNVVDVQRVINASLGSACVTGR